MDENTFNERKKNLLILIKDLLLKPNLSEEKKSNLKQLARILDSYSFENRKKVKGFLSHIIIDQFDLEDIFYSKFIEFDQAI